MDKNKKKRFIIGGLISILSMLAGSLIAPIEVRYINSLTDNTILIGLVYSIGAISAMIFSWIIGRWSDRVGRGRFILLGVVLGVFCPILCASVLNVFQYMGIKFAWALSGIGLGSMLKIYLEDLLDGSRKSGKYFGYLMSIESIMASLGALLGGILSDNYSLKTPYYAMACIFVLIAVISFSQFSFKKQRVDKEKKEKRSILFASRYILKNPILSLYFIQKISVNASWGVDGILWPLIIYNMSQSDVVTGSIFSSMGLAAFLFLPVIGILVDRYSLIKNLNISLILLGTSGLFLALTDSLLIFWMASVIYSLGKAWNGPTRERIYVEKVKAECRGELSGFNAVVNSLSMMFASFIVGVLLKYFGPQSVLFIFILFFWVTFFILNIFRKIYINKGLIKA